MYVRPFTRRVSSVARITLMLAACVHIYGQASAQGLVESATGNAMRPKLTARDVPSNRGRFTFPDPYNTEAARITDASDCDGSDCVRPVGYAYWSNINNHVGSDTMLIFLSLKDHGGPTLFSYNKNTGETRKRGSLFDGDNTFGWARLSTGEGWYFSGTRPNAIYINEPTGSRLFRYDVLARSWETVFDISGQFPNKYLWQVHSSNDDRVHSFTVRDKGSYAMEGCGVYREGRGITYFARRGNDFDECQIDKSGRWLVIKEDLNGDGSEDNRVIDVDSNTERILMNADGAAGHSDVGYGYMVAEDNMNTQPGAVRVWDFAKELRGGQPTSPVAGQGTLVYQLADWMPLAQHIAHGNSKSDASLGQQIACASNGSAATAPRVNEVVCFRLDGSLNTLVVAPTLTDVNAAGSGGGDGDAYWKYPKGNLDITGEYFIWTSNGGTNRLDAYIVKVPVDRLGSSSSGGTSTSGSGSGSASQDPSSQPVPSSGDSSGPAPSPTPAPSSTSGGDASVSPVSWTDVVNATTIGNSLMKAGGCGGCADAGAISAQSIASGDGYVEFTVPESDSLRFIGLSSGNGGTDPGEIRFGLRLQGGRAEVRESGAYRTETGFAASDTLRIAYAGGTVQYSKNGSVFYTSGTSPAYPAIVDTTLFDDNATIWNVMIASGSSGSSSPSAPQSSSESQQSTPQTSGPVGVTWTSDANVAVNGNSLVKTGGCSGCADAGAVSAQQISADGYVEFSGEGAGLRFIGLSSGNNGTDASEIRFAMRLQGNTAEVRENGAYRTEISFSSGDTLRVAVAGGNVEYSKNGGVFYTSTTRASFPLLVDTTLFDNGATINNVVISGGN